MAKSSPQEQKSELEFLQKQKAAYDDAQRVIQQYNKANQQTKVELQGQLVASRKIIQSFIQQFKSLKDFNNLLEKTGTSYENLIDKASELGDTQDGVLDAFKDLDKELISVGNTMDKNTKSYSIIEDRVKAIKSVTEDISKELQSGAVSNDSTRDAVQETAESYVHMNASVIRIIKQRKKGAITEDEYISQLNEQVSGFREILSAVDLTNIKSEELIKLLQSMNEEAGKFANLMKMDTKGEFSGVKNYAAGVIGGVASRLPGGSELTESVGGISDAYMNAREKRGELITQAKISGDDEQLARAKGTNASDLIAAGSVYLAIAKAFVGVAKGIMEIANVPITAAERLGEQLQKDYDILIQFNENVARMAGNIPAISAAFDFDTDLMKMSAEFNAASKTAFLGSGLGSIQYGGAQLQLAGISAEQLVTAMGEMSALGNSASKSLAVNTAVFSRKTGLAVGDVSQLVGQFRMLDKTGASEAFTDLEKSLSGAGLEGYNVADIADEMKDSGALALQYNIKSSKELIKQVKSVRDMGGSFSKISEAGKNMVLNYKDSIRKEMELSAMLGENVDLSEARALFAAGRNDEAFGVLKSSGILEKAQSQGLFGTQTLSAALGGMDITQMAAGKFEKGDSKGIVSNQTFLNSLQDALKNLRIDVANIEITRANQRLMQVDRLDNALIYSSGEVLRLTSAKKTQAALTEIDVITAQAKLLTDIPGLTSAQGMAELFAKQAALTSNVPGQPGFMINKEGLDATSNLPYKSILPLGRNPATNANVLQDGVQYTLPGATYQPAGGISSASTGMAQGIDSSNTGKSIDGQSSTLVRILDRNHKSMIHLEQISTNSSALLKLTQNIQTLTATMSDLPLGFAGMKLLIDGKDVKSRIEKIQTQEKATKK
jgi:hypothetical protein